MSLSPSFSEDWKTYYDSSTLDDESSMDQSCHHLGICEKCSNKTQYRCSRCQKSFFCSRYCQKSSWPTHFYQCSTTASVVSNCNEISTANGYDSDCSVVPQYSSNRSSPAVAVPIYPMDDEKVDDWMENKSHLADFIYAPIQTEAVFLDQMDDGLIDSVSDEHLQRLMQSIALEEANSSFHSPVPIYDYPNNPLDSSTNNDASMYDIQQFGRDKEREFLYIQTVLGDYVSPRDIWVAIDQCSDVESAINYLLESAS